TQTRQSFDNILLLKKILNGLSPSYLSELLHVHTPIKALRSSNQMLLDVPGSRLKTRGDQAFSVAAPNLWNSLPIHVRTARTIATFKSLLKTHYYSLAFN
uniref:Uncharacterized protein n=1 Tax=Gasterosteus aculeatus TaxID=69293 RepID=G3PK59_GASAC